MERDSQSHERPRVLPACLVKFPQVLSEHTAPRDPGRRLSNTAPSFQDLAFKGSAEGNMENPTVFGSAFMLFATPYLQGHMIEDGKVLDSG